MKNILKHFSVVMAIVLFVGILSAFAIPTAAASGSTYSSNPTIAARIDKVLSTYGPNSFFTKNGKACSCHATSSIDCVSSPSSCNCLRKVTVDGKTVDLLAVQCFGYARYWQQVLFGAFENNTSKFQKLSGVSGSLTASNSKTWFTNNKASLHPGTHIRCYSDKHSIILLGVDYNQGKVTYIQSNWVNQSTNNGTWCKVSAITTKTWSDFASTFGTLNYAQVYKNYYTEFPDEVTPPLATDFNATIKDGIYSLKIAHTSGKMLNVDSGDGAFGNGTLVNTYDRDGSITQKFYFKHESNGKYRIYAVCSGSKDSVYNQAVDVNIGYGSNDVLNVGDSFDIWEVDSKWDNCQLFYIVPIGEGKYVIELASIPQAVLGAKSSDSASTNGGAITLQNYTSSTTQQWYFYNESGSAPVDPTINGSLTYTVNYSASGATNVPSSQSKIHGSSINISSTIPTKSGYSFLGWSTSDDNTVEYQAGATYTANSSVTLYAVWSVNEYTVNYNSNGGNNISAQTKVHDVALTLSSTTPTKSGYSFLGWSTSNDASVEYQAGATYTANANVTLYAVWKANEYIVSYYANGGANAPAAQTKVYEEDLTLSSNIPTKTGYTFVGWALNSNSTTALYQAGGTYTNNESAVLYAVWTQNVVEDNTDGDKPSDGDKPVVDKETVVDETTVKDETAKPTDSDNVDKNDNNDNDEKKSGCNSSAALSGLAIVGVIGAAFACKKKKEN